MTVCHVLPEWVVLSLAGMNAMEDRAVWNYSETGSGETLILLHGIGMSHTAWDAVIPQLALTRAVIAFDIAGFGSTPPLPGETVPTIAHLVDALERSICQLGITTPVDIAGNSLGATMALEAARRGLARSVVAISPPGLWKLHGPSQVRYIFGALRFAATRVPRLLKAMLKNPVLREIVLSVPLSVGSHRMPVGDAVRSVDELAAASAFEETFESTRTPFVGRDIGVQVTVAFGTRDWILTKRARRRDGLPPHTRWVMKPGWGHVPMWVDPHGVAQLILEGTGLRRIDCGRALHGHR
jgi:pimeloyl-ACP methyl ester carboxylesterase